MNHRIAIVSLALLLAPSAARAQYPTPPPGYEAAAAANAPDAVSCSEVDGARDGHRAARDHGSASWGFVGLGAGAALAAPGCAWSIATAESTIPPPPMPQRCIEDARYLAAYDRAFRAEIADTHANAAAVGGTIGTILFIAGAIVTIFAVK